MEKRRAQACPCLDAHRRLMDLHEDIHRAAESYMDANEFRRNLNQAIQNSRSVTFLLQKRKAKWADFDDWYGTWQAEARGNAVLSWGVNSRNRIVKEEDLATFSQAIVGYYGDRVKEAEEVLTVPPTTTVRDMLALFGDLARRRPANRQGVIRVQRRWVDDQLPEFELIAALREMYASVAQIIDRAHRASNVEQCLAPAFTRGCITSRTDAGLTCLGTGDPLPSGLIDVATGEFSSIKYQRIERDDDMAEVGMRRYGPVPELGRDVIEHAAIRMQLSRSFLEADGYAGPMLVLGRGMSDLRFHAVPFPKRQPRELAIAAAVDVNGAWQYDGAVFASESWLHSSAGLGTTLGTSSIDILPSNTEFFDPDPIGNRDEALFVTALAKDGRSRVLIQPFGRTASGIVYGPLIDDETGALLPHFLRPVWHRWDSWKHGPPAHA